MSNKLTFDVDVNVINHLGVGLYSSIPGLRPYNAVN